MAVKIGELLVQEGLLSHNQLDEALKYQVIFGGKLGTNLIEMGFLQENEIASCLSKKLNVPLVDGVGLRQIPEEIIKLIPRDLAVKYQAIPVSLDGRRLQVVMADPSNLKAIDELSFRTGFVIKPAVTPEIRLVYALEKYYQVKRDLRYIRVEKAMAEEAARQARATTLQTPKGRPPVQADKVSAPAVTPGYRPIFSPEEEELEVVDEDESLEDSAEESTIFYDPISEDELCDRFEVAKDREDIAKAMIAYFNQRFKSFSIFLYRDQSFLGWYGVKNGSRIETIAKARVPLTLNSAFKRVFETRDHYLGPVEVGNGNDAIIAALGLKQGENPLFVPLKISGKVVAILSFQGGGKPLSECLPELNRIVVKTAIAFELLILKNKMRAI